MCRACLTQMLLTSKIIYSSWPCSIDYVFLTFYFLSKNWFQWKLGVDPYLGKSICQQSTLQKKQNKVN